MLYNILKNQNLSYNILKNQKMLYNISKNQKMLYNILRRKKIGTFQKKNSTTFYTLLTSGFEWPFDQA